MLAWGRLHATHNNVKKMQQSCQLLGTAGETELGVSEELESSFQQNLKLLELQ